MYKYFIYFILFSVMIYTPAIVNWYSELYILDILILLIGGTFIFIQSLKFNFKYYKVSLLIIFIFLLYVFAYSASGNFLDPIYGIKQLIFFFSFLLFSYVLIQISSYDALFSSFFKFYSILFLMLYLSGFGMKIFPNSLLPRLTLDNIILFGDLQLVGSSAILTGTLSVVVYTYFLINTNTTNRILFLSISILLIIFSGTRASFLEIIIVHFILALSQNYKKAIKMSLKIIVILILISPLIYLIFQERITDADSNSVHLMLWGMAIAMFLQNPTTGLGVNTFHQVKNEYVDYSLPESYGTHSTLFKFLGEGGLLLLLVYLLLWYLFFYFFKKRVFISKEYYSIYIFSCISYFVLMFHSIFDNFLMAKVNEYLYVMFLSLMYVVYRKSKRVSIEK